MKQKIALLFLVLGLLLACTWEIGGVPAFSQPRGYDVFGIDLSIGNNRSLATLWIAVPAPSNSFGSTAILGIALLRPKPSYEVVLLGVYWQEWSTNTTSSHFELVVPIFVGGEIEDGTH